MNKLLDLIIEMAPVAKGRPRFARGIAYTPKATKDAEKRIRDAAKDAFKSDPYDGAVDVAVMFYLERPKSKSRKKHPLHLGRPDVDNFAKLVLDALNGIVWVDDGQVVNLFCAKRYADDMAGPCIEVNVAPFNHAMESK